MINSQSYWFNIDEVLRYLAMTEANKQYLLECITRSDIILIYSGEEYTIPKSVTSKDKLMGWLGKIVYDTEV